MLPLHTTFKSLAFVLLSSTVFTSCSNKSKKDIEIIRALNESVEISNKMISISTMDVMMALRNKMEEPGSSERAKVWYPKAEKIQQLSKESFDYIEKIKQKIKDSSINSAELFDKLKLYRDQTLQVDPKIRSQFEKSLPVFTRSVDSSKNDQEKLFKDYFTNTSSGVVVAMLNKIQNNIRINELRLVTFCNEHVGSLDGHGFATSVSALIILNSSVVKPGGSIEITSGMGHFNTWYKPEVFVNEKLVPMNEGGVAICKLKAPTKPGKYYVPVKIDYFDPDGRKQSFQKEIEYTVANIQQQ